MASHSRHSRAFIWCDWWFEIKQQKKTHLVVCYRHRRVWSGWQKSDTDRRTAAWDKERLLEQTSRHLELTKPTAANTLCDRWRPGTTDSTRLERKLRTTMAWKGHRGALAFPNSNPETMVPGCCSRFLSPACRQHQDSISPFLSIQPYISVVWTLSSY